MIRLTIRATDESVPAVLMKIMEDRLALGMNTRPERVDPPMRRDNLDAFANVLVV